MKYSKKKAAAAKAAYVIAKEAKIVKAETAFTMKAYSEAVAKAKAGEFASFGAFRVTVR